MYISKEALRSFSLSPLCIKFCYLCCFSETKITKKQDKKDKRKQKKKEFIGQEHVTNNKQNNEGKLTFAFL